MHFSKVVLPVPLGPKMPNTSPLLTLKLTLSKTLTFLGRLYNQLEQKIK